MNNRLTIFLALFREKDIAAITYAFAVEDREETIPC